MNVGLEVLRFQVRLAKDLNALPVTGHGEAARRLEQVGAASRRLAEGVEAEGGAGMKRHGDLWPAVVSWPNLVRAADRARRGSAGATRCCGSISTSNGNCSNSDAS